MVGGGRKAGEEPNQIIPWIEPATKAGAEQGVESGGLGTGFGGSDEEPVLFAYCRGSDGILDLVVVDFNFAPVAVNLQGPPLG